MRGMDKLHLNTVWSLCVCVCVGYSVAVGDFNDDGVDGKEVIFCATVCTVLVQTNQITFRNQKLGVKTKLGALMFVIKTGSQPKVPPLGSAIITGRTKMFESLSVNFHHTVFIVEP